MSQWIGTADAFRLTGIYKTYEGLRRCGVLHGFAKKAPDGFHYIFDRYKLLTYMKKLDGGMTVFQIAEAAGVTPEHIHYEIIKIGLVPTAKWGPRFVFNQKDAQLLIDINNTENDNDSSHA